MESTATPVAAASAQRAGQTQVALTAFLNLFSLVGLSFYGLPFFYDFMVKEFGWSRTTVTSGNAFGKILVGPLFGFLAGWVIDRFGPRRLMIAGVLMGGASLIGLSWMTALWMFYLCYLFNALGYVCGGPLPNQVLLSRRFDQRHDDERDGTYLIGVGVMVALVIAYLLTSRFEWLMLLGVLMVAAALPLTALVRTRGKAMGVAYLGIGIGGAVVPLIAFWLTQRFGWHRALLLLGVMMIVIALPLAWFVPEATADEQRQAQEPPPPMGNVFRSPAFYLLAVGSMCSIGAVGGTNQHLKLFLSLNQGYSQGNAAKVISMVLGASIVGRLLMGRLADRFPKKYVMLLIYVLVAAAIPLLFFIDRPGVIYLFAIVFGIGVGGDYMIIPLMAAELFGVRVLGRLMGVILTADGLAEALSPMFVGRLYDQSQSYAGGFGFLILLAALGAAAVALLPKKGVA